MGNNNGGPGDFFFKKGDPVSAKKLNQLAAMIIRKIVGAPPVRVRSTAGGVVIQIDNFGKFTTPLVVPAKVTEIGSSGAYTVDTYEDGFSSPAGREGLLAYAVDDAISFAVDQKVTMFSTKTKNFIVSGGGSGEAAFQITDVSANNGTYVGQMYDAPRGTPIGDADVDMSELALSPNVPEGRWVTATLFPDGIYWFNQPLGAC